MDELRIKILAEAQEAIRQLQELVRAEQKVGTETEEAGRKAGQAAGGHDKLAGSVRNALSGIGSLVGLGGGVSVVALASKLMEEYTQRLRDNTEAQNQNAQATANLVDKERGLLFLGADRQMVRFSEQEAISAGRSPDEGVAVAKEVLSRPGLAGTPEAQRALIAQTFQLAMTEGSDTAATQLQGPFFQAYRQIGDPALAASQLRVAINQAGIGNAAQFGDLYGKVGDPLVMQGHLTPQQALATTGAVVGLGGSDERLVQGLRTMVQRLYGDQTPESTRILRKIGFDPATDDFNVGVQKLVTAREKGLISDQEFAGLVGSEGIGTALKLSDPRVREDIASKTAIISGTGADFLPKEIVRVEAQNPEQKTARIAAAAENQRNLTQGTDTYAQTVAAARAIIERELVEGVVNGKVSATEQKQALAYYDTLIARGYSPYAAAYQTRELVGGLFSVPGVEADISTPVFSELGVPSLYNKEDQLFVPPMRRFRAAGDSAHLVRGGDAAAAIQDAFLKTLGPNAPNINIITNQINNGENPDTAPIDRH